MKYIRVKWIHDNPEDPVWLFSELDDDRGETRKVEIFANGSKGFASELGQSGGAWLAHGTMPTIGEIAADPQFLPEEIAREEFETIWSGRFSSEATSLR